MSLNTSPIKGTSNGNMKNKNIKRRTNPYLYKNVLAAPNLAGRNVSKSQWPSRGGIGKRLNMAKDKFNITTVPSRSGIREVEKTSGRNLKARPKRTAKAIFDAGPAMATLAGPYFLSLKFKGLYGTGFA